MTKAEQKKMSMKARYDFIDEAAKITLSVALATIPHSGVNTEVRLKATNRNRYFTIHRHCEDLKILIYVTGDIDIVLHEFCHQDTVVRLIHYAEAVKNPEATLALFKEDVEQLASDFVNADWHYAMDYLSHYDHKSDWHDYFKECRRCYLDEES